MSLRFNKSAWKRVALGEVVRHITDRVDAEASGLERFLAGQHIPSGSLLITDWGVIGRDPIGPMFYKRFQPSSVLYLSRRTYLRKIAVPDFEGVTGEKTFVLESIDRDVLLQEFLPFVLSAEVFHDYAIRNSRGSVNPYLNWGELAAYEFNLPSLDEQRRIADLLWAVERHRVNAVTSAIASANAKSSLLAERLKRGVEQQGWPKEPVTAVVKSGPTNGKSAPPANDQQRGVPTLSISAVREGGVRGGDSVKWVDVDPASIAAFQLQENDFLIVRGNGNRSLTGRGGLVSDGLPKGCIYPDLLIRLRFDEDHMLPAFGAEQWNSANVHAALLKNAKSSNGIWKINGKDIKSHRLVVPPIQHQFDVLKELAYFDVASGSAHTESLGLTALRSCLLVEIFGGK